MTPHLRVVLAVAIASLGDRQKKRLRRAARKVTRASDSRLSGECATALDGAVAHAKALVSCLQLPE